MENEDEEPEYDVSSFRDILSKAPIMPDETIQDFEAFQLGMLADLEPKSAYAHVIADNIIANEWELYRLRRWFEILRLARGQKLIADEIQKSVTQKTAKRLDIEALAKAAMTSTGDQIAALDALDGLGIDVSQALASAYAVYDEGTEHIEKQLL